MTNVSRLAAAVLASAFLASSAFAQTAAPAAKSDTKTSTAAPSTEKKTQKPHSAESLECSKQADEKGLHGKERKKFRSECIKSAKTGSAGEKAK